MPKQQAQNSNFFYVIQCDDVGHMVNFFFLGGWAIKNGLLLILWGYSDIRHNLQNKQVWYTICSFYGVKPSLSINFIWLCIVARWDKINFCVVVWNLTSSNVGEGTKIYYYVSRYSHGCSYCKGIPKISSLSLSLAY